MAIYKTSFTRAQIEEALNRALNVVTEGKSFTLKGEWTSGGSYANSASTIDVVLYDGVSYFCRVTHSGRSTNPKADTAYWGQLAGYEPLIKNVPQEDIDESDTIFFTDASDNGSTKRVTLANFTSKFPSGRGIASIERTSGTGAPGTTDTYTITYTDNNTTTFQIYNGADGAKGDKGDPGADGRPIEFRETATHIQWRYVGDTTWNNLFALTSIKGDKGDPGEKGEQGDPGNDGADGRGIVSIARTSGTGAAGTTDTYTITFTDSTTATFQVYNGADGDGAGDMRKAVYDPTGKNTDIFGYVDAHKAEIASEDNVHGLRGEKVVIGRNSNANDAGFIAIGDGAEATSSQLSSIAIGKNAKTDSFAGRTVVIGENASAGASSVAIGFDSFVEKGSGVAVGRGARVEGPATSAYSIAIGEGSLTTTANCVAIGRNSQAAGQYSFAIGAYVVAENLYEFKIGGNNHNVQIPGNFTVNGTKNFEIPHPKPEKKSTHRIRHGAVESPTAGDTLYRWKIQATKDNDLVTIDLPDYFVWLNKDVQIWVTGQGHFGNGYGILNRETEQLEIHCQFEGEYNVLVIGTRNDDHQSVKDWNIKGVEREIGESWTGETYAFSVDEIIEIEEIKEVI